jgi:hypothetical protein
MRKKNICVKCENRFIGRSQYQQYCDNCRDSLKGGNNTMVKEKEVAKPVKLGKLVKEKKEKIPSNMVGRQENTLKLIDYMKNDLHVEGTERLKLLSRTYNYIKKQE